MFSKVTVTKVYQKVMEQIMESIKDGTLKRGDRLPSERDLVDQLGVSRTSIREALRALEIIGLIESRQGEGNFISEQPGEGLFQSLSMLFMLRDRNHVEVLEFRKIMEVGIIALAAERITDEELEELRAIIQKFKTNTDEKENMKLDTEFHYVIVSACGNNMLSDVFKALSALVDQFIKEARTTMMSDAENQVILLEQHEKIFNALEAHDSALAEKVLKEHLDFCGWAH